MRSVAWSGSTTTTVQVCGSAKTSVFDSPIVLAHGRQHIADQFVLAFALPGLEVRSELRDVICSDFEFDGTRAGLIDHTVTVTLFPQLVGQAPETSESARRTPGALTSQGSVTPHPFFNYYTAVSAQDPPGSSHRRRLSSHVTSPLPPMTPRSTHTNGALNRASAEPLPTMSLGPSALEPVCESESSDEAPLIPLSATRSTWAAPNGLGRRPAWTFLYDLLRPSRTLRMLLSVELRILSRLEFNEAGRIVRHEDTWSVRELIEGIFPFLALFSYLYRICMGLLVTWWVKLRS